MTLKKLMNSDELWIGEKKALIIDGVAVVLIRTQAGISAFLDRCPHAGAPMSQGFLEGDTLTCGRHHWQFNACTGQGLNPLGTQLEPYPLIIDEAGIIWFEQN